MRELYAWFESLPLSGTIAVVTCISATFALACTRIRSRGVKWTFALIGPSVIAWCVYWTPVWMGAPPSEYSAWSGIFVAVWGVPATIASALVVFAVGRLSRDGTHRRA